MLQRSFIAFQLPDKAKRLCQTVIDDLVSKHLKARWVKPENRHITVNFLGDRPSEDLLSIAESINSMHTDLSKICFEITCFKIFGSYNKVLTLELTDKDKAASKIINEILLKNNLKSDYSEWIPHITLARLKTRQEINSLRAIELNRDFDNFRFSPEDLAVYTSTLTPSGPIYCKVKISNS